MSKPSVSRDDVSKLCACFLQAANDESEGRLFRNWSHYNREGELAIERVKDLFKHSHFGSYFTTVAAQNNIGKGALEQSGVDYESCKKALKNEGLGEMVTILGRVSRMPR